MYSEGLDNKFAEKVSMKSHLSTLSLTSAPEVVSEDFIESVIPFIDEGYVAYSTFFFIEDATARGGKRTIGIVTLVDRSEQMTLYRKIPDISATVKKIASELYQIGDPKNNLTDEIKSDLNDLTHLEKLSTSLDDPTDSTNLIKKRLDTQDSFKIEDKMEIQNKELSPEDSFHFLLNKFPDGIDQVIYALLKNERILVVGNEYEIKATLNALKEFLPHKETYSNLWTVPLLDAEALFSKSVDDVNLHILGISKEISDELEIPSEKESEPSDVKKSKEDQNLSQALLLKDNKIIIDYTKNTVIGGMPNLFCTRLVSLIKNIDYKKSVEIIKNEINYLLERVNEITTIFLDIQPSKEEIESFIDHASPGEISLIISIIEDSYPSLLKKIIEIFAQYQLSLEVLF